MKFSAYGGEGGDCTRRVCSGCKKGLINFMRFCCALPGGLLQKMWLHMSSVGGSEFVMANSAASSVSLIIPTSISYISRGAVYKSVGMHL